MIRITGGLFRGRRLRVPAGIRPTTEIVRKALFDILGSRIEGARFLDAAAGSGAVGLEGISRGASNATFLEMDRRVRDTLSANIEALGVSRQCLLVSADLRQAFLRIPGSPVHDFVFLDLPYDVPVDGPIQLLAPFLDPESGQMIVERGDADLPLPRGISLDERRNYGSVWLAFLRVSPGVTSVASDRA